jgi:hypothetical protein
MKTTSSTQKSIPVPPQVRLAAAIESRLKHPLYPAVCDCIEAQDLMILAEVITDRKPLGWVIEAFATPETEIAKHAKMIDTACRVFDGVVKAIEAETRTAEAQPEIDAAMNFAVEILRWAQGGWETTLQSFTREMRGVNPKTLEVLGFTEAQVTLTELVVGKPQWGELSLLDIAHRVVEDESVLNNRAFRRAALSGFASFFRFAYGQTGSEDTELLDWADEIATTLYGEDAKLTDRSRGGNAPKPDPKSTAKKKPASKIKAQERGTEEYKSRMDHKDRNRGYVQEGGRPKKG